MLDAYTPIYTQGYVYAELDGDALTFIRILAEGDFLDKLMELDTAGGNPSDDDLRELGFMEIELMRIAAELSTRRVAH